MSKRLRRSPRIAAVEATKTHPDPSPKQGSESIDGYLKPKTVELRTYSRSTAKRAKHVQENVVLPKQPGFLDLPNEILLKEIFHSWTPYQLRHARLVNRRLSRLLFQPLLNKCIFNVSRANVSLFEQFIAGTSPRGVVTTGPLISSLSILRLKFASSFTTLDLENVFAHACSLECLVLHMYSCLSRDSFEIDASILPHNLVALAIYCDNLIDIDMVVDSGSETNIIPPELWLEFKRYDDRTDSVVNTVFPQEDTTKPRALALISLFENDTPPYIDLFPRLSHLKTLVLAAERFSFRREIYKAIAKHCHCLEELRIKSPQCSNERLKALCANYHNPGTTHHNVCFKTSITHLILEIGHVNTSISARAVIPQLRKLPNLVEFRLVSDYNHRYEVYSSDDEDENDIRDRMYDKFEQDMPDQFVCDLPQDYDGFQHF